MTLKQMHGMLGLAARARQISFGTDAVLLGIRSGKAAVVIMDKGVSENTFKKINDACAQGAVPLVLLPEGMLGEACGKDGRMVACMQAGSFAEQMKTMLSRSEE